MKITPTCVRAYIYDQNKSTWCLTQTDFDHLRIDMQGIDYRTIEFDLYNTFLEGKSTINIL